MKALPTQAKPALEALDEAISLLRRCPPAGWAEYFIGTVPFVIGFLYYWAEMSRGAFARDHLTEYSLAMAAGFIWIKWWQACFGARLLATAAGRELPPRTFRTAWKLLTGQTLLQASGLFLLPLAAILTIPFGYVYAFYQNVTVLGLDGAGEPLEGGDLRREAQEQAQRWAKQNHLGLVVLMVLFGLVVFLNLLTLIFGVPLVIKVLLGIETVFTLSPTSMMNTTLLATAAALTYLCLDPILKAFYAWRCFQGRSLLTGEDLRVEMRIHAATGQRALAAVLAVLMALAPMSQGAPAPAAPTTMPATGKPAEIDRSVTVVLERPEFAWREPRRPVQSQDGWLASFFNGVTRLLRTAWRAIVRVVTKAYRWLASKLKRKSNRHEDTSSGLNWQGSLELLAWVFCGVAVLALTFFGWRAWRRRKPVAVLAAAQPLAPDLTAEETAADQLPEDGWLKLAAEMKDRGELRLALRAYYLAALAHLGGRQYIALARHKSNYDYQRELRRRRPAQQELQATFADTVFSFDRAWYGKHEVTDEILAGSHRNLEKIRLG